MTIPPSPAPVRALTAPVWVLLTLCILPELVFQLNDHGMVGPARLREMAFSLGSFQSDLVNSRLSRFPGQSFTMFMTYMFLHTGLSHLVVNMIGLLWLWRLVTGTRSAGDAALFFVMAGVGAAMIFDILGSPHTAMVGASGALFGLLGVYGVDSRLFWSDTRHTRLAQRLLRLVVIAVILIASDLVSRVATGTSVAWQAHTGGFLTGAFAAMIWPYR
ncbi:Rhomboid family protein [Loktanella atrilutea]|uniref:Rhomboid family protein n=1 Tax=Loktanella atrilutea TaxID=366533 RepID=A0A1M5F4V2_LOKAT|nr:rhomboid family intramembrane serine protease [Loktanella atrilutea]SHF86563.1 Rhomboid family protein [Loktanella atrilutea]